MNNYLTVNIELREYCRIIFTEPQGNNCFSIITQVIIREITFSLILFVSFSEISSNRTAAIFVLQYHNQLARGEFGKI